MTAIRLVRKFGFGCRMKLLRLKSIKLSLLINKEAGRSLKRRIMKSKKDKTPKSNKSPKDEKPPKLIRFDFPPGTTSEDIVHHIKEMDRKYQEEKAKAAATTPKEP